LDKDITAFIINKSGEYSVIATDNKGCESMDTIIIELNSVPTTNLPIEAVICGDETLVLDAGKEFIHYKWNDNSTSNKLKVYEKGSYSVELTDLNNCKLVHTINVAQASLPTVELGEDISVLQGELIEISAKGNFKNCIWNEGTKASTLSINTAELSLGTHQYDAEVSDKNGCTTSDFILIEVKANNQLGLKNRKGQEGNNGTNEQVSFSTQLFPNPASTEFTVIAENLNPKNVTTVEIFSTKGELVKVIPFSQKTRDFSELINVQELSAGKYFVKILNGKQIITKELIVIN